MTEAAMGGPLCPNGGQTGMSAEALAIIAANRHIEERKGDGVPPEVAIYLKEAEGNDAEIERRLRLVGAIPPRTRQTPPPAAPPADGDKPPSSAQAEIAERIQRPLW